jgi:Uma2 family endonuclease
MTTALPTQSESVSIFYPSSDGELVAETYVHLYALLVTLEVLKQYLDGQQAMVLGNQFVYYSQGFPKLRVAPDVMVILNVPPGERDNYKIWQEGQTPTVIFEMTSEATRKQDEGFKKMLYEQLGVQEYWLFDPKGEWLENQLCGYRLQGEQYEPITDGRSQPLKLRLAVDGSLIAFYREDTGEKLLIPSELAQALKQESEARRAAEMRVEQERQRAEQAEQQVEQLKARLRALGVDLDTSDAG